MGRGAIQQPNEGLNATHWRALVYILHIHWYMRVCLKILGSADPKKKLIYFGRIFLGLGAPRDLKHTLWYARYLQTHAMNWSKKHEKHLVTCTIQTLNKKKHAKKSQQFSQKICHPRMTFVEPGIWGVGSFSFSGAAFCCYVSPPPCVCLASSSLISSKW